MKKHIAVLFSIVTSLGIYAQEAVSFDKATEAYNDGEYKKAIDLYLDILESGKHSG